MHIDILHIFGLVAVDFGSNIGFCLSNFLTFKNSLL